MLGGVGHQDHLLAQQHGVLIQLHCSCLLVGRVKDFRAPKVSFHAEWELELFLERWGCVDRSSSALPFPHDYLMEQGF